MGGREGLREGLAGEGIVERGCARVCLGLRKWWGRCFRRHDNDWPWRGGLRTSGRDTPGAEHQENGQCDAHCADRSTDKHQAWPPRPQASVNTRTDPAPAITIFAPPILLAERFAEHPGDAVGVAAPPSPSLPMGAEDGADFTGVEVELAGDVGDGLLAEKIAATRFESRGPVEHAVEAGVSG